MNVTRKIESHWLTYPQSALSLSLFVWLCLCSKCINGMQRNRWAIHTIHTMITISLPKGRTCTPIRVCLNHILDGQPPRLLLNNMNRYLTAWLWESFFSSDLRLMTLQFSLYPYILFILFWVTTTYPPLMPFLVAVSEPGKAHSWDCSIWGYDVLHSWTPYPDTKAGYPTLFIS